MQPPVAGNSASASASSRVYEEGSSFYNGYACIKDGDRYFYIDSTGAVAFDSILNGYLTDMRRSFNTDSYDYVGKADGGDGENDGATEAKATLPYQVLIITKDQKQGVLSLQGKILLEPIYDQLDLRSDKYWTAIKAGKQSIYTASDGFILPFEFDEVGDLDGTCFNVVNHGKWGIYNRKERKLVVPCIYENMDYCYGCQDKGNYVFAQKNGKWGIIDLRGKVLLPFEYEHKHTQMRSDQWVYCLLKNGVQRQINLKTGENRPLPPKTELTNHTEPMAEGFVRKEKDGAWGMLSPSGKLIYDYQYDFIRYDADEPDGYYLPAPYVALRKNDLCGLGDTTGNIIIPLVHKEWIFNIDSFFVGRKDSLELLYNNRGHLVISEGFDNIARKSLNPTRDSIASHIIILRKNKKYGFYNGATGAYRPPTYDDIEVSLQHSWADTSLMQVRRNTADGQYQLGLVDAKTGKEVLPPVYSGFDSYDVQPDNIVVRKDSLYGLFNVRLDSFTIPVESKYFSLMALTDVVKIQIGSQYGLRDSRTGAEICPPIYNYIVPVNKTLFILVRDSTPEIHHYSLYNLKNHQITELPYDVMADCFAPERMLVLDDHKARLYNPVKNQIIEGPYSENGFPQTIGVFSNGRACYLKNGKLGFMDPDGNIIQPAIYDKVTSFNNGKAIVLQSTGNDPYGEPAYKYGLIDSTGKTILPVAYDFVKNTDPLSYFIQKPYINLYRLKDPDSETKGADVTVAIASSSSSADKQSRPISPARYQGVNNVNYAHLYYKGLAKTDGTVILPPAYDGIHLNNTEPYILLNKNKLYGISDLTGKQVLPVAYEDIWLDAGLSNYDYMENVDFKFPLLVKKSPEKRAGKASEAGEAAAPVKLWQYLDHTGQPLQVNDIRVRSPMRQFPHKIKSLF